MLSIMSMVSALSLNINSPQINPAGINYYGNDSLMFNVSLSGVNGASEILADFDNTLIAWYRFNQESGEGITKYNDQIKDWSTYNNDITLTKKSTAPIWDTNGKFGGSYKFDGSNDGINLGVALIPKKGDFTISLWFNSLKDNEGQIILSQSKQDAGNFALAYGGTENKGKIRLRFASGSKGIITSTKNYPKTVWHNVVITRDLKKGKIYLYVDGELDNSKDFSGNIYQNTKTVIGMQGGESKIGFRGNIDEVQIYSRAISLEEIKSLYDANTNVYAGIFNNLLNKKQFTIKIYGQDSKGNTTNTSLINFIKNTSTQTNNSNNSFGGYINLTACGTLNQANTVYHLTKNVSSTGTCFTIAADNITLDGRGYSVKYSTSNVAGFGFNNSGYNDVVVKNANFNNIRGSSLLSSDVYFYKSISGSIFNNTFILNMTQVNPNIVLENSNLTSLFDNTIIKSNSLNPGVRVYYSNEINFSHNLIIVGNSASCGLAVSVLKSTAVYIFNNSILNNCSNTDAYVIQLTGVNMSTIYKNVLIGGSMGSSGGVLSLAQDSNSNNISDNYIRNIFSAGVVIRVSGDSFNNLFSSNVLLRSIGGYYDFSLGNSLPKSNFFINQNISNYFFGPVLSYLNFDSPSFGRIHFFSGINGVGINLFGNSTSEIQIGNNSALINSTINPGLNRSANITFYHMQGWGFTNPQIFRNGQNCQTTGYCVNLTPLTADTVVFNVSGEGKYNIA